MAARSSVTDQSVGTIMARAADPKAKRLQILEAAAHQFARTGYEATVMDDVAEAAGVSKGSLYDYFKNKEDLFYAVFEWFQAQLLQASVADIQGAVGVREQLAAFAEATVGALVDRVNLYPVTLEVWAASAKSGTRKRFAKAMRMLYANYRHEVSALIRTGQTSGEIDPTVDPDVLASMLIGAVDGLMLQYWLDPSFDAKAWVRTFLSNMFDGVGAKKPGKSEQ
ncbi:MAG: TetR family transcriptional regulator [Alphaproteobacteria bacterium]|nr:TetR family transcriptional regulator [Alphaproteobacteria bacterium]